jgi:Tfp pilus assembly protein PilF
MGCFMPWTRVGIPAVIFLASFLAFSPALEGSFLNWDDNLVLTNHHAWRGLGGEQIQWAFTTHHSGHYHPLTWLSFELDYALWGEDPKAPHRVANPFAYHLVNLLLHAAGAVLFYFIVLRLLPAGSHLAAAAGALFFAIHPLRVESVAWITERRDVLSGAFLLATVLMWLKWIGGDGRKWYGIALFTFLLSLLSKAWGMTLPVVLLIMDMFPLRRFVPGRRWAVVLEKWPFFVLAIAAALAAFLAQKRQGAMDVVADHTLIDRVVQSGYGLFFYVAKTIVPVAQNPLYILDVRYNPFEFQYVAAAVGAVALTLGVILARRRRPEWLAAWAIYVVSVSPVLGLAQSGPQLVAERYTYLACLPFAVLAAAGLVAWMARSGARGPAIVTAIVVAALGVKTWSYSHDWRDSVSLWTQSVKMDPGNARAWFNLGSAKLDLGRMSEAFEDLSRVIEIDPNYIAAYQNRGVARMERDPKGAIADFDAALKIHPEYIDALLNRAWVRFGIKETGSALADFDTALKLQPRHFQGRLKRAIARMQQGDRAGAAEDLAVAMEVDPRNPDVWYVRGQTRDEGGDVDGAISDYIQALNLGGVWWDQRKRDRAEDLLARARRRKAGS